MAAQKQGPGICNRGIFATNDIPEKFLMRYAEQKLVADAVDISLFHCHLNTQMTGTKTETM